MGPFGSNRLFILGTVGPNFAEKRRDRAAIDLVDTIESEAALAAAHAREVALVFGQNRWRDVERYIVFLGREICQTGIVEHSVPNAFLDIRNDLEDQITNRLSGIRRSPSTSFRYASGELSSLRIDPLSVLDTEYGLHSSHAPHRASHVAKLIQAMGIPTTGPCDHGFAHVVSLHQIECVSVSLCRSVTTSWE